MTNPASDPANSSNNHQQTLPLRSKGWDGKLRVGRAAEEDEAAREAAEGPTPPDSEDDDNENEAEKHSTTHPEAPAGSRIVDDPAPGEISADEDLLVDMKEDEPDIDLNHCRITNILALRLERFHKIERLCLRQNQISSVHFPPHWGESLQELDLYDNSLAHIKGLDGLVNLTSLDLSFNSIRHIKRVSHLKRLRELFFVQNRISKIENLDDLPELRNLELGGNRLRDIEGLEGCPALEELWLGKNKITALQNLTPLINLRLLSIQSNRLTSDSLSHLSTLPALEELYISHNLLDSITALGQCPKLTIIDVSSNPIKSLDGLGSLSHLEEFWASDCQIDSFDEVEKELGDKQELTTVYFEGNPLQMKQPVLYRNKVRLALPRIKQIDATFVRVD